MVEKISLKAQIIDWALTNPAATRAEIAAHFHKIASPDYVRQICIVAHLGAIQVRPERPSPLRQIILSLARLHPDWACWRLAAEVGCSRTYVRMVILDAGESVARPAAQWKKIKAFHEANPTLTADQIAADLGVSYSYVRSVRARKGVPIPFGRRGAPSGVARGADVHAPKGGPMARPGAGRRFHGETIDRSTQQFT